MSSTLFLKIIKIKYSFVICNIDICYVVANFHRYEDSDGA